VPLFRPATSAENFAGNPGLDAVAFPQDQNPP
jgi:hypothetical protein